MLCSGGGSLIVLKMIVTGMTEVRHVARVRVRVRVRVGVRVRLRA